MTTLSLRLDLPGGSRFGPGKAALLSAIDAAGSIAGAARQLGMSYPKASRLVGEINAALERPAVETSAGGAGQGGAMLTAEGRELLAIYHDICTSADRVAADPLSRLSGLLAL